MFSVMRTMVNGLAVHRTGSHVVFLPGAGLVGLDFLNVAGDAVLYDRGGTGWSDPVPLPRSAAAVATELHDLLSALAVPGPYVLVGHSMGAVYARRFAQLFPADTQAMLLLDPGHEDLFDYLPPEAVELNQQMRPDPTQLPDLTAEQIQAARKAYADLYASWPAPVRHDLVDYHLTHWRTALHETAGLESDVYPEVRAGGPVPDVPTIVLSAALGNPQWSAYAPPEMVAAALDGINRLHATIAAGSSHGEHRVVEGATHQFLHIEHPEAVTEALRTLTQAG
jgi:pimeloyl-ACP methyl ester carboxylesterase